MDILGSLATAKSVVSAAVLTYQELKTGVLYKDVTVPSSSQGSEIIVHPGGIEIKIHIPDHHVFDKALDFNGKMEKFKEEKKINVRYLLVNARDKKYYPTPKKALLSSDLTNAIQITQQEGQTK